MRHLATPFLFIAAALLCLGGIGPLFFGPVWLGALLFSAGIVLEMWSWRRLRHPVRVMARRGGR